MKNRVVLELKTQKYHLRYLEQLTNESGKHRKHRLIEERNIERDKFLQVCGIKTLRFKNDEVLNNLEQVKHKILTYIPPCPVKGRGGEGF